jgi:hypothetical protein
MTNPETITSLSLGDTVPIGTALVNMIIMGIVTDVNNPNMFGSTLQAYQSQALLTVPVLQGIQGNPGQPSFALRFQNSTLTSPSQLPNNLTNAATDLGKYWVFVVFDNNNNAIAATMYVWYGTTIGFRQFPIGTPGPAGPYPLITPHIVLQAVGNGGGPGGADSWISVTGTVSNPVYTYNIAAPTGLTGPTATLDSCPDIDFVTTVPVAGDALIVSPRVVPGSPTALQVNPSGTGGTFAAGTYFWVITAVLANGSETMPSNETATAFTGSTSSAVLTWVAPSGGGAVGFKVYRGTSATNISALVAVINSGTIVSFTDTGGVGTPGQPPNSGVIAGRPIWTPTTTPLPVPQLYTLPSSAFTSIATVGGATITVATFAVPPQPWPWKPYVTGQLAIFGLNISLTPFQVGAQVLLGDPSTGVQVARGFGNSLGYTTLIPQASTTASPAQAMTPSNNVGLVSANHVGNQGTLYFNLIQEGMAGVYAFSNANAQGVIMVIPSTMAIAA